jgi:hypothetical protein
MLVTETVLDSSRSLVIAFLGRTLSTHARAGPSRTAAVQVSVRRSWHKVSPPAREQLEPN